MRYVVHVLVLLTTWRPRGVRRKLSVMPCPSTSRRTPPGLAKEHFLLPIRTERGGGCSHFRLPPHLQSLRGTLSSALSQIKVTGRGTDERRSARFGSTRIEKRFGALGSTVVILYRLIHFTDKILILIFFSARYPF